MIVHQEKISQQQHLLKQQQQQEQQQNKFALLSSLLSGDPQTGTNGIAAQTGTIRPAGEKVAKAMKRTAVLSTQARQQPVSASLTDDSKPTTPTTARLGKAVKHTAPIRASNSNIILNDQTNQPPQKDISRSNSNNLLLPNGQRLSGVRQASLIASIQPARSSPSSTDQSTSNKVTITTTYVYKRVTQEPEIDLNMECEEEEIEYIRRPAQVVVVETLPVNDDNEEKEDKSVKKKQEKESRSKQREEERRHGKRRGRPSEKTISDIVEVKSKKPGRKPLSVTIAPEASKSSKKTVTTTAVAVSSVATSKVVGVSGFKSIFEKYYGRREGALQASMSGAAAGKSSFKKNVPYDLRVGRFPPKVMLTYMLFITYITYIDDLYLSVIFVT